LLNSKIKTPVRVGFIGAGKNTCEKHIPGFQKIPEIKLVGVANRSDESSKHVVDKFGMSKAYPDWHTLIDDDEITAVCIGTWPDMHSEITIAALQSGKHVLCEARMARNYAEAKKMYDVANEFPGLVAQIVPSPFTLGIDLTIKNEIASGRIGDVLAVDMRFRMPRFADPARPISWRENIDISGHNIMGMGIGYEAMMRWLGPAKSVIANTKIFNKQRPDESGSIVDVKIPDHVDIIANYENNSVANIQVSSITAFSPYEEEGWIFGTEGTLKLDFDNSCVYAGYKGDDSMHRISLPTDKQSGWRVEEEFVNAINGVEKVTHTTFEDGLKYMEFTEAVYISATEKRFVELALT
jgi:predicted dehydrogenase